MLFNSHHFIFIFLPVSIIGFYYFAKKANNEASILWLVLASIVFYGWWNPVYLFLILGSILFNYSFGILLSRKHKKRILGLGIAINLFLLGYFKYTYFFLSNINHIFDASIQAHEIILPLAISFFTFQQITYLVDAYRGETKEYSFIHYCLFVTFFPQLIAGPIVHHKEMMPQFLQKNLLVHIWKNLSIGSSLFIVGLFKKVVLADQISKFAEPMFQFTLHGGELTFFEAWAGVLSFSFQIYFDFSGYSDMAIGLARMFGIVLPINFYSPYKSVNIVEFWRRWHISLSRFLREYLYIPLGGNSKGNVRRYANIMLVMLLGGLWHGDSWNFVIWGGLHGFYIIANHFWHFVRRKMGHDLKVRTFLGTIFSCLLTHFAVVIAWVFFRAESLSSAKLILKGMFGCNGVVLWDSYLIHLNKLGGLGDLLVHFGWQFGKMDFFNKWQFAFIILMFVFVWLLPNAQQIFFQHKPTLSIYYGKEKFSRSRYIVWSPKMYWAIFLGITFVVIVTCFLGQVSEFIYFQF